MNVFINKIDEQSVTDIRSNWAYKRTHTLTDHLKH